MSPSGPSAEVSGLPRSVHDVDERTGEDIPLDDAFPRRLHELLVKGHLYEPSEAVVREFVKRCDELLQDWWKEAERESEALGHPHLVQQTEWLKLFNRAYNKKLSGMTLEEFLSRTEDHPLPVRALSKTFLDEGGVPQQTYPGMMLHIDEETQRGLVATIPLLPGTMVGQFLGTVTRNFDGDKFKHPSKLEKNYSINMKYAGEDYVINPVISTDLVPKPASAAASSSSKPEPTKAIKVESGAFLNEPRTYKKGLHGKVISDKRQLETDTYAVKPDSLTARNGGKKRYTLNGMQWDRRLFYTDGTLSADTVGEAWKSVKRPRPRDNKEALPSGWWLERGQTSAKRLRPKEPHGVEMSEGLLPNGNGKVGLLGNVVIPLADLVIPDDIRDKLVANVQCVRAELPLCFYELHDQNKKKRGFYTLKQDTLHADMAVKTEQVYAMCDRYIRVWIQRGGKSVPAKYELHDLVGRKKDDRRSIQPYDILHLKNDGDTFIGCERFVVVLPIHRNFENAFEFAQLRKWAVENGKTPADITILRFYRRKDAWCCPTRQVGVELEDGRWLPYPWYRVGHRPILPRQELLFVYMLVATKKYGLHAIDSDDETTKVLGPLWSNTPKGGAVMSGIF